MKTGLHLLALACVLSFLIPGPGAAASEQSANPYIRAGVFNLKRWKENRKAPATDRINDEDLAAIKAQHPIGYGKGFVATERPVLPHRSDFYANSVILRGDRGDHSTVPKKALIHLPEELESRVLEKPQGPYAPWPEFCRSNRSWLRSMEISVEQAKGEEPLTEEARAQFVAQPLLVVGVYKGFPISVLSPASSEEETEDPGAAGLAATGRKEAPATKENTDVQPGPRP